MSLPNDENSENVNQNENMQHDEISTDNNESQNMDTDTSCINVSREVAKCKRRRLMVTNEPGVAIIQVLDVRVKEEIVQFLVINQSEKAEIELLNVTRSQETKIKLPALYMQKDGEKPINFNKLEELTKLREVSFPIHSCENPVSNENTDETLVYPEEAEDFLIDLNLVMSFTQNLIIINQPGQPAIKLVIVSNLKRECSKYVIVNKSSKSRREILYVRHSLVKKEQIKVSRHLNESASKLEKETELKNEDESRDLESMSQLEVKTTNKDEDECKCSQKDEEMSCLPGVNYINQCQEFPQTVDTEKNMQEDTDLSVQINENFTEALKEETAKEKCLHNLCDEQFGTNICNCRKNEDVLINLKSEILEMSVGSSNLKETNKNLFNDFTLVFNSHLKIISEPGGPVIKFILLEGEEKYLFVNKSFDSKKELLYISKFGEHREQLSVDKPDMIGNKYFRIIKTKKGKKKVIIVKQSESEKQNSKDESRKRFITMNQAGGAVIKFVTINYNENRGDEVIILNLSKNATKEIKIVNQSGEWNKEDVTLDELGNLKFRSLAVVRSFNRKKDVINHKGSGGLMEREITITNPLTEVPDEVVIKDRSSDKKRYSIDTSLSGQPKKKLAKLCVMRRPSSKRKKSFVLAVVNGKRRLVKQIDTTVNKLIPDGSVKTEVEVTSVNTSSLQQSNATNEKKRKLAEEVEGSHKLLKLADNELKVNCILQPSNNIGENMGVFRLPKAKLLNSSQSKKIRKNVDDRNKVSFNFTAIQDSTDLKSSKIHLVDESHAESSSQETQLVVNSKNIWAKNNLLDKENPIQDSIDFRKTEERNGFECSYLRLGKTNISEEMTKVDSKTKSCKNAQFSYFNAKRVAGIRHCKGVGRNSNNLEPCNKVKIQDAQMKHCFSYNFEIVSKTVVKSAPVLFCRSQEISRIDRTVPSKSHESCTCVNYLSSNISLANMMPCNLTCSVSDTEFDCYAVRNFMWIKSTKHYNLLGLGEKLLNADFVYDLFRMGLSDNSIEEIKGTHISYKLIDSSLEKTENGFSEVSEFDAKDDSSYGESLDTVMFTNYCCCEKHGESKLCSLDENEKLVHDQENKSLLEKLVNFTMIFKLSGEIKRFVSVNQSKVWKNKIEFVAHLEGSGCEIRSYYCLEENNHGKTKHAENLHVIPSDENTKRKLILINEKAKCMLLFVDVNIPCVTREEFIIVNQSEESVRGIVTIVISGTVASAVFEHVSETGELTGHIIDVSLTKEIVTNFLNFVLGSRMNEEQISFPDFILNSDEPNKSLGNAIQGIYVERSSTVCPCIDFPPVDEYCQGSQPFTTNELHSESSEILQSREKESPLENICIDARKNLISNENPLDNENEHLDKGYIQCNNILGTSCQLDNALQDNCVEFISNHSEQHQATVLDISHSVNKDESVFQLPVNKSRNNFTREQFVSANNGRDEESDVEIDVISTDDDDHDGDDVSNTVTSLATELSCEAADTLKNGPLVQDSAEIQMADNSLIDTIHTTPFDFEALNKIDDEMVSQEIDLLYTELVEKSETQAFEKQAYCDTSVPSFQDAESSKKETTLDSAYFSNVQESSLFENNCLERYTTKTKPFSKNVIPKYSHTDTINKLHGPKNFKSDFSIEDLKSPKKKAKKVSLIHNNNGSGPILPSESLNTLKYTEYIQKQKLLYNTNTKKGNCNKTVYSQNQVNIILSDSTGAEKIEEEKEVFENVQSESNCLNNSEKNEEGAKALKYNPSEVKDKLFRESNSFSVFDLVVQAISNLKRNNNFCVEITEEVSDEVAQKEGFRKEESLLSLRKFKERANTFDTPFWRNSGLEFLPLARNGWTSVNDLAGIHCNACQATLEVPFLGQYVDEESLVYHHCSSCFWRWYRCPMSYVNRPISGTIHKRLATNIRLFYECFERSIPRVHDFFCLENLGLDITTALGFAQYAKVPTDEIGLSSVILSLCGWKPVHNRRMIQCSYCDKLVDCESVISVGQYSNNYILNKVISLYETACRNVTNVFKIENYDQRVISKLIYLNMCQAWWHEKDFTDPDIVQQHAMHEISSAVIDKNVSDGNNSLDEVRNLKICETASSECSKKQKLIKKESSYKTPFTIEFSNLSDFSKIVKEKRVSHKVRSKKILTRNSKMVGKSALCTEREIKMDAENLLSCKENKLSISTPGAPYVSIQKLSELCPDIEVAVHGQNIQLSSTAGKKIEEDKIKLLSSDFEEQAGSNNIELMETCCQNGDLNDRLCSHNVKSALLKFDNVDVTDEPYSEMCPEDFYNQTSQITNDTKKTLSSTSTFEADLQKTEMRDNNEHVGHFETCLKLSSDNHNVHVECDSECKPTESSTHTNISSKTPNESNFVQCVENSPLKQEADKTCNVDSVLITSANISNHKNVEECPPSFVESVTVKCGTKSFTEKIKANKKPQKDFPNKTSAVENSLVSDLIGDEYSLNGDDENTLYLSNLLQNFKSGDESCKSEMCWQELFAQDFSTCPDFRGENNLYCTPKLTDKNATLENSLCKNVKSLLACKKLLTSYSLAPGLPLLSNSTRLKTTSSDGVSNIESCESSEKQCLCNINSKFSIFNHHRRSKQHQRKIGNALSRGVDRNSVPQNLVNLGILKKPRVVDINSNCKTSNISDSFEKHKNSEIPVKYLSDCKLVRKPSGHPKNKTNNESIGYNNILLKKIPDSKECVDAAEKSVSDQETGTVSNLKKHVDTAQKSVRDQDSDTLLVSLNQLDPCCSKATGNVCRKYMCNRNIKNQTMTSFCKMLARKKLQPKKNSNFINKKHTKLKIQKHLFDLNKPAGIFKFSSTETLPNQEITKSKPHFEILPSDIQESVMYSLGVPLFAPNNEYNSISAMECPLFSVLDLIKETSEHPKVNCIKNSTDSIKTKDSENIGACSEDFPFERWLADLMLCPKKNNSETCANKNSDHEVFCDTDANHKTESVISDDLCSYSAAFSCSKKDSIKLSKLAKHLKTADVVLRDITELKRHICDLKVLDPVIDHNVWCIWNVSKSCRKEKRNDLLLTRRWHQVVFQFLHDKEFLNTTKVDSRFIDLLKSEVAAFESCDL